MAKAPKKVQPYGGMDDYQHDALSMPEWDADAPCDEDLFAATASLADGHSGVKQIDTTFENYSEADVYKPRSDRGIDPAPRQTDRMKTPHRRY